MTTPRLLLADDHRIILTGYRNFLTSEGFHVVGAVETGQALLEQVPLLTPHLVILDLSMPRVHGVLAAERLREEHPHLKLLVSSMYGEGHRVAQAMRLGVHGYLTKDCELEEVAFAVRMVLQGYRYITPRVLADFLVAYAEASTHPALTYRQKELLQLIAEGHPRQAIAERLQITPRAVDHHRQILGHEYGLTCFADYVRLAISLGLLHDYTATPDGIGLQPGRPS